MVKEGFVTHEYTDGEGLTVRIFNVPALMVDGETIFKMPTALKCDEVIDKIAYLPSSSRVLHSYIRSKIDGFNKAYETWEIDFKDIPFVLQ